MWKSTGERCFWGLYHPVAISTQFDIEPVFPASAGSGSPTPYLTSPWMKPLTISLTFWFPSTNDLFYSANQTTGYYTRHVKPMPGKLFVRGHGAGAGAAKGIVFDTAQLNAISKLGRLAS